MNKGVSFRRRLLETATSEKEIRAICFSTLNPNEQQTVKCNFANSLNINLQYSTNGVDFQTYINGQEITFGGDNKVWFRGKNKRFATLYSNYSNFKLLDDNVLTRCDGNIMHLLDYEQNLNSFNNSTNYNLAYLFYSCRALYSCPDILIENANTERCFSCIFENCVNLKYIPKITIKNFGKESCSNFFKNCTNLEGEVNLIINSLQENVLNSAFYGTKIRKANININTNNILERCFKNIFYNCDLLEEANINGSLNLGNSAFSNCFDNCDNLKTFNADSDYTLNINSVDIDSLKQMFLNCTKLETININLNAEILANGSYYEMFKNCSKLQYIKCLAEDLSATNCVTGWTTNVSSTGTFIKKDGAQWNRGDSGIPTNWTVENVSGTILNINLTKDIISEKYGSQLNIQSDINWEIFSYPNWVQLDKLSGSGNDSINVQYIDDQQGKLKTGTIFVKNLTTNTTEQINLYGLNTIKQELTFIISSNGTLRWKFAISGDPIPKTIEYTKDGGTTWTSITSSNDNSLNGISVSKGDIISFRGNNAAYAQDNNIGSQFGDGGIVMYICGNIMSLIDSTNFENLTQLTQPFALHALFKSFIYLIDASNLSLPAATLTQSCYRGMFDSCSRLLYAPELPASQLVQDCYRYMFNTCSSLIYIKCLCDTNINNGTYTSNWLASAKNTNECKFVKKSTTQIYKDNNNGIPTNWVIENL